MKKFNTSPISGMQELLPAMQYEFNRLKSGILQIYTAHGFQNIETPTIDRTEVLLAKAGGDTEKQIYKVIKTAETSSEADQALRFDHTVPLARYVVEHANDLVFPFKVSQIGRNFRGERAQKGRFREFYQCDVDIIGWQSLPVTYDAEVIVTLIKALRFLPLPEFIVRLSNRKLLSGLLEALNLEHQAAAIFEIVDHAEKVPHEITEKALMELGIGTENVVKITTFIQIKGDPLVVVSKLKDLSYDNATFVEGVAELEEVASTVQALMPEAKVQADMLIVRGLDYYTGTVFETIVPQHPEIGSICSGGRYENLAGYYTEQKLPGVGGSIGLTRLFYVLQSAGYISKNELKPVEICVIPVSHNEIKAAGEIAEKLRTEGKTVDIVLTERKLGDKFKYAARVARYVIVVGENEVEAHSYKLRDLETGEETNEAW